MTARRQMYPRLLLTLWPIPALAALLSCAEPGQAPLDSGAPLPLLIVSNPVASSVKAGISPNSAADEVAYISMPPGALRGVLSVRIRNVTTNSSLEAIPVIDGGFDPVAVAARAGDRLELRMDLEAGAVTVSYLTVPLRRPPRIVRTVPAKGRTDVALNTRPIIVFSEPIDARTLSNMTVRLVAGTALNGTVRLLPGDVPQAEFTPATPLTQNTAYELVITTDIQDLDGDALESSERIPFRTTVADPGAVSYLWLSRPPVLVPRGFEFGLLADAVGTNGNVLPGRNISWALSDTSVARVSYLSPGPARYSRVLVTGTGTTTLVASSGGGSGAFTFTSVDNIPVSDALEIDGISLIEFEDPIVGYPPVWAYAPKLQIRQRAGSIGVSLAGVRFIIPGVDSPFWCMSSRPIMAGLYQTIDVFKFNHGDYELYVDSFTRATSNRATAIIYVIDANGRAGYISVSVPIVTESHLPDDIDNSDPQNPWVC